MSNVNLLAEVQRGYTIFTKDFSLLQSNQQKNPFITPGISATSLYSKFVPSNFSVTNSPFTTVKQTIEDRQLVGNEGGDQLAKPHLDPEFFGVKAPHQIGHGEPTSDQSYEVKFSQLLDKFNHPHFDTATVKSESVENASAPRMDIDYEREEKQAPKRKIPNLKAVTVTKKVPPKKPKLEKKEETSDFNKQFFDFSQI